MAGLKPVHTREGKTVKNATIEVPGPVESWDPDEPWDWLDWPNGPVGAARTGGKGVKSGRSAEDAGLNPFQSSFVTAKSLLKKMQDAPPGGMGVPVCPQKYPVVDETEMARNIKATARYLGADLIGIADVTPERIKLAAFRKEQDAVARFTHFIAVAVACDPHRFGARLRHPNFQRPVRAPAAGVDLARASFEVESVCAHLAGYIRGLGYNAESQGSGRRVMNGPFANWAGLGETGRLNLVVTPEFGPRVDLGGVLTDLPLAEDQPIDFGVQSFCESCKKCVRACPAGALTDGPKQLVRGVLKWSLNRKLCAEVGKTHGGAVNYNCQECMAVCAYSPPPNLVDYGEHEEGESAVLGLWTELWHERGWVDSYVPPAKPERTAGKPS